jgi:hypothetical protein
MISLNKFIDKRKSYALAIKLLQLASFHSLECNPRELLRLLRVCA